MRNNWTNWRFGPGQVESEKLRNHQDLGPDEKIREIDEFNRNSMEIGPKPLTDEKSARQWQLKPNWLQFGPHGGHSSMEGEEGFWEVGGGATSGSSMK